VITHYVNCVRPGVTTLTCAFSRSVTSCEGRVTKNSSREASREGESYSAHVGDGSNGEQ
jgi:hypothetical protein